MFPSFQLELDTVASTLDTLIEASYALISDIIKKEQHAFETLVLPLSLAENRIGKFMAPISHLHSVANTPELRSVYQICLEKLSAYHTNVAQNWELYQAYQRFTQTPAYEQLNPVQQRIITLSLRDFTLSGIHLPSAEKATFKQLQIALNEASTTFENNLLDATDTWQYHCPDSQALTGLSALTLSAAQEKATSRKLSGYLFGLDHPTYAAILQESTNRDLRKHFYFAYLTRASDLGENPEKFDNSALMSQILQLRQQEADLLKFNDFAELSLATKMAKHKSEVLAFLYQLLNFSREFAQAELNELTAFAKTQGFTEANLQPWDVSFYSELFKKIHHGLSSENLRTYFPAPQVLKGLFELIQQLFEVSFVPAKLPTWHAEVQTYALVDTHAPETPIGYIYLDLYARDQKRGGAWMDDAQTRCRLPGGEIQKPIAFLTCNFQRPVGDQPALLTHDDILTLFHEMGHCLHNLLSKVDYLEVSGTHGVPWDAVELPSQFLENFCWDQTVLERLSGHYQTQEKLPDTLFQKLQQIRYFQLGLHTLRQVELALFDFLIHQKNKPLSAEDIQQELSEIQTLTALIRPAKNIRFQHGFSHIFAGGYAAGYYSYKWAELLSQDAFSRFEEEGIFNAQVAADFKKYILEAGGSADPMELFIAFRGRKPSLEPLLEELRRSRVHSA